MKDDSTCAEPKQGREDVIIDHSLIVLRDQGETAALRIDYPVKL